MNEDKLRELRIHPSEKRRSARSLWIILLVVALVAGAAVYYAIPRASDAVRVIPGGQPRPSGDTNAAPGAAPLGAGARALAGSATNVPA
ncbi:MAG TPA: efflux RND transporter periplasmic adaptor subunit, partial [Verrucomicrobiota bacterium]|nr:efflux RND transporter periplasmic adaptor subunit [Verrucomicrobiota bacterium]